MWHALSIYKDMHKAYVKTQLKAVSWNSEHERADLYVSWPLYMYQNVLCTMTALLEYMKGGQDNTANGYKLHVWNHSTVIFYQLI